ncbi:hypothetical protein BC832DRAFT_595668 [Gaertneriomyces semiglobifer]|nr:hypothetical protein BC832DRAFT_595668 [Gaertneriomyces semiglobifer]
MHDTPHRRGVNGVWRSPPFEEGCFGKWNVIKEAYGNDNREIVPAPETSKRSTNLDNVLRVRYPAKSYVPSRSPVGGTGFYARPTDLSDARTVQFRYEVYFENGFDFVKGGKLPGMYGGHPSCSGGSSAQKCFSTRFMFREDGMGEVYLYVPRTLQHSSFCDIKPQTMCNDVYGASVGRGSFKFRRGEWTELVQIIGLNSHQGGESGNSKSRSSAPKPKQDGTLTVKVNGETVISFNKMVWTVSDDIQFEGIEFETFFGGSTKDWRTPKTQYAYFRGFELTVLD